MMLVLPVHGRGCQVILLKTAENLAGGCMFNEIGRGISLVCSPSFIPFSSTWQTHAVFLLLKHIFIQRTYLLISLVTSCCMALSLLLYLSRFLNEGRYILLLYVLSTLSQKKTMTPIINELSSLADRRSPSMGCKSMWGSTSTWQSGPSLILLLLVTDIWV